jgi:hypothetical protein
MVKRILTVFLITLVFACSSQDKAKTSSQSQSELGNTVKNTTSTSLLSFLNLRGSKWIIGEVGLNGEKPDTMIFATADTLFYISTDTGKELCPYILDKDTLIFYNHSIEADLYSSDDLNCKSTNKLHYKNNSLKYIYSDKKCTGDQVAKRILMDSLDLRFKRL